MISAHPARQARRVSSVAMEISRRMCRQPYIEHITQADPTAHTRLREGFDEFVERDQDRALFDLPPRPKNTCRLLRWP